ncbi:hypothetical protein RHGRI_004978 [Rhododendron griersonianum]|uniref:Uncharacterized protein n=1 Tax=Rhododendron griersonianum TaxID=479676 RepID=A0AAV6LD18_9ERIC|nr:hypothetical protein RHGRI_004978 [Rhododendron griersonianum]
MMFNLHPQGAYIDAGAAACVAAACVAAACVAAASGQPTRFVNIPKQQLGSPLQLYSSTAAGHKNLYIMQPQHKSARAREPLSRQRLSSTAHSSSGNPWVRSSIISRRPLDRPVLAHSTAVGVTPTAGHGHGDLPTLVRPPLIHQIWSPLVRPPLAQPTHSRPSTVRPLHRFRWKQQQAQKAGQATRPLHRLRIDIKSGQTLAGHPHLGFGSNSTTSTDMS